MSTNILTEANTLERARLNLKFKTKGLDVHERARRSILLGGDPTRDLSPGAKAATSPEFLKLAAGSPRPRTTPSSSCLRTWRGAARQRREVKALITGLSDTSAGSFVTNQSVEYFPQPRRRLRVLDLCGGELHDVDAVESRVRPRLPTWRSKWLRPQLRRRVRSPRRRSRSRRSRRRSRTSRPGFRPPEGRSATLTRHATSIDGQLSYACQRALEEAVVAAMVADAGRHRQKGRTLCR